MAQEPPIFDYHEETQSEKLARKSKESPFMVIGIAGLTSAVGYGVYKYKNRGAMSTSVFLMQFRVISQGIAVGALTAGMAYTLYKTHFNSTKDPVNALPKPNQH
ncbi:HIG1 domain family member 1A, mitochondrial-like [Hyposmocoma kahamanoa]|uniref:HIG1 domain family member 1A, mitochondrial-like n=1 Tax=Hyposmocoma kahamanoa TaxID=1477025 RepID=UPI000E6D6BB0|nr:HIG1 domain family member 1A, mitochondrial-like [Hyposmocoma kahamanoa]XP_026323765.1 HIG1 domain family member 1A, mitochondrial-like [Hyposmocoma kahamanoa]